MSKFLKQHEGPTRYKKGKPISEEKPPKLVKADKKMQPSDIVQEISAEPKKEATEEQNHQVTENRELVLHEKLKFEALNQFDQENEITFLRGPHVLKLIYEKQKNNTYAIKIFIDAMPIRPMTFTGKITAEPYWNMLKEKYSL